MDFGTLQNGLTLATNKKGNIISFQEPIYKRWSSVVFPEEEIDIREFFSRYQISLDLEIQDLKDQINLLSSRVSDQFQVIQNLQNRRIIPIQNLRSRKLRLINPLYVNIEYEDSIHVVFSEDLNLYGYGEIELNAIRDFCKEVEYLYFDLKKSKGKLGKAMKENWNFLKDVVKEK